MSDNNMKRNEKLVAAFLHYCRVDRALADRTLLAYSRDLEKYLLWLGDRDAILLTRKEIKEYISELNEAYSVASVKRKLASLKGLYSYLEELEYIEESPACGIRCVRKEPKRMIKSLTLDEMRLLLNKCYEETERYREQKGKKYSYFVALRNTAIIEVMFATGVRVQELCSLTIDDYDLYEQSFRIMGKGNKERLVFITNRVAIEALRCYLSFARELFGETERLIFKDWRGGALSQQTVREMIGRYSKEAGIIKHVTPHMIRHTFASLLLESGADLRDIQLLLGHSSIVTTQIYLHPSHEHMREMLAEKHPRNKL